MSMSEALRRIKLWNSAMDMEEGSSPESTKGATRQRIRCRVRESQPDFSGSGTCLHGGNNSAHENAKPYDRNERQRAAGGRQIWIVLRLDCGIGLLEGESCDLEASP